VRSYQKSTSNSEFHTVYFIRQLYAGLEILMKSNRETAAVFLK